MFMNKKERIDAAVRGDKVDRVPVSVWQHDYAREWDTHLLMQALVENFTEHDWDFMKVNPRETYFAEAWKARYRPSGEKYKAPIFDGTPIRSSSDWKRIRQLDPDHGPFVDQLRLMQLLNHQVGYDAYFVQTIFCPLGVARYLVGNNPRPVLDSMREDRSALHAALRVITETLINYAIACMEEGASGIFYVTNGWATQDLLTQDQYHEFGEQYDLEFLDAIKSRSKLTILHNCGERIYFDSLAAYPVQIISWDAFAPGNPNLQEGKLRSGKAVMGGLNCETLRNGSPRQVQEEVAQVLESTGEGSLLLAPGCAVSPDAPLRNLEAVRRVVSC
jgi:uroporphyrinogen decarboxylase